MILWEPRSTIGSRKDRVIFSVFSGVIWNFARLGGPGSQTRENVYGNPKFLLSQALVAVIRARFVGHSSPGNGRTRTHSSSHHSPVLEVISWADRLPWQREEERRPVCFIPLAPQMPFLRDPVPVSHLHTWVCRGSHLLLTVLPCIVAGRDPSPGSTATLHPACLSTTVRVTLRMWVCLSSGCRGFLG